MKYLAIINRKCFNRRSKRQRSDLIRYLSLSLKADIKFSEYPGHIYRLLDNCKEYDVIVAAGGDGTIHEIVNSMDLEKQKIMILPIGGGNTLASDLNIKIANMLKPVEENDVSIDIIKCTFVANGETISKYTFSTTGFGFSGNACFLANRKLKFLGSIGYVAAGVIKLFSKKAFTAEMSIDDHPIEKRTLNYVFINNTKSVACFRYFPEAEIDDGFFDAVITHTHSFKMFLFLLGTNVNRIFYRPFEYLKMKKIFFKLNKPEILMLDGELYHGITQVEYAIAEKSLHLKLK